MTQMFDLLRIANTSLGAHQTWMDALANNIANVNTVTTTDQSAFQAQYPIFSSMDSGGVDVTGVAVTSAEGRLQEDPTNPLADSNGYVRAPDTDLASNMTQLIMAQRGFQASTQVVKHAQIEYEAAIKIGQ